jgi:phosphoglycerate kinase
MAIKSIAQAEIKGKKILVRFDFNVPLDKKDPSKISDTTRIDAALPTLKYLMDQEASKIIMMSHLGRPDGKPNAKYSLEPVASYLAEKLGKDVILTESCLDTSIPTLINLPTTKLVLLENLRFHAEEENNDRSFAEKLSHYADLYVNDAFGVSHRKHASVYEINAFFQRKNYAGFLLLKEVETLEHMLNKPQKPFMALLGGAKVADKIKTINRLLIAVDKLFIGGAMSYPFLKAKGINIGKSLCDDHDVELAKSILRSDKLHKIELPLDHVVVKNFDDNEGKTTATAEIDSEFLGLDIGPQTIQKYQELLSQAKTIFWNGPMGYFEKKAFAQGTFAMAKHLASCKNALTIIGGGDSVSAVQQSGYADQMGHISTGGGASLEFIEKGELPGVQALKFGLS